MPLPSIAAYQHYVDDAFRFAFRMEASLPGCGGAGRVRVSLIMRRFSAPGNKPIPLKHPAQAGV